MLFLNQGGKCNIIIAYLRKRWFWSLEGVLHNYLKFRGKKPRLEKFFAEIQGEKSLASKIFFWPPQSQNPTYLTEEQHCMWWLLYTDSKYINIIKWASLQTIVHNKGLQQYFLWFMSSILWDVRWEVEMHREFSFFFFFKGIHVHGGSKSSKAECSWRRQCERQAFFLLFFLVCRIFSKHKYIFFIKIFLHIFILKNKYKISLFSDKFFKKMGGG